ncbi:MAG: heavy metal-associated domain-containing protein [Erysipelotrichaceae bacterium]|nr:heavy-metal-associated domain-containing protein [Erysipelotrichaceae bacterium]
MQKRVFQLNPLSCPTCAKKIETVLLKVDGVESAEVSFTSSKVNVAFEDTVDVTILIDRIHRLGYRVLESKKA